MYVSPRTVSPTFRSSVAQALPALGHDRAYRQLTEHILMGTWRDRDTGRLLLGHELLAVFEGKEAQLRGHHYVAEHLLKRFDRDVMPIHWTEPNHAEGRCRELAFVDIPREIVEALEVERSCSPAKRVYFTDGAAFTPARQQQQREIVRRRAMAQIAYARCAEAADLLHYMNNLPPRLFGACVKHVAAAEEKARNLETGVEHQLTLLRVIRDQPQPFYKPTEKSVRIFPLTESMLMLKSSVRQALTPRWGEFDLRSAQLAIGAHLWGLPGVQAFLERGEQIWPSLFAHFDLPMDPSLKSVFKEGLYSLMFGMGLPRLTSMLNNAGAEHGLEHTARRFLAHPMIAELTEQRTVVVKSIQESGGGRTIYGDWLSCASYDALSILAQQCQAMELALLYPVVKLARSTEDFRIVLWQHDGFSVTFAQREERWTRRIQEAVAAKAAEFGISTVLERTR